MAEDKEPAEAGRPEEDKPAMSEDEIDRNLVETFPASDPPSWTLGTDHRDESPNNETVDDREQREIRTALEGRLLRMSDLPTLPGIQDRVGSLVENVSQPARSSRGFAIAGRSSSGKADRRE